MTQDPEGETMTIDAPEGATVPRSSGTQLAPGPVRRNTGPTTGDPKKTGPLRSGSAALSAPEKENADDSDTQCH